MKKLDVTLETLNPSKTCQIYTKILNKVRTELPKSPCKKTTVVKGLTSDFSFNNASARKKPLARNKEKIEVFYYRTDIIYTMPGTKYEIVIWNESGKHQLQKHYLTINLKEAHTLFLESCEQEDKCSFSTFCNTLPKMFFSLEVHQKNNVNMKFIKTLQ